MNIEFNYQFEILLCTTLCIEEITSPTWTIDIWLN